MHNNASRTRVVCRVGFSLIELLVVVVIIAMIAAIMLPSLRIVREASKASVCASKLRQIAMGIGEYTAQFGQFPPAAYWNVGGSGYPAWDAVVCNAADLDIAVNDDFKTFSGAISLFRCPSDTAFINSWDEPTLRSYAVNTNICSERGTSKSPAGISDMSRTILVTDRPQNNAPAKLGTPQSPWCGFGNAFLQTRINAGSPPSPVSHREKFNYAFCDLHIELLSPMQTIGTGTITQGKGMWTPISGD
jgi:prepilin-type N-terminal cleavage/methylation domain-containing protein/prepilin-type processing-associated H-X9-DG protein